MISAAIIPEIEAGFCTRGGQSFLGYELWKGYIVHSILIGAVTSLIETMHCEYNENFEVMKQKLVIGRRVKEKTVTQYGNAFLEMIIGFQLPLQSLKVAPPVVWVA